MRPAHRRWVGAFAFTAFLVALIAFSVADVVSYFLVILVAIVVAAAGLFYTLFPGSLFFSLSFANFLAVYACIFTLFVVTNFAGTAEWALFAGFPLPVLAFLGGALWRRRAIREIVTSGHLREARHLGRIFIWIAPIALIGVLTFLVPGHGLGPATQEQLFVAMMATIAAVVLLASRDVSTFLLDTGLLFEEFFHRMSRAIALAFAFFTFYSLTVIVFAGIYRLLDRLSDAALFRVGAAARDITFPEALYFSVVTMSTVGYGDITPAADAVRAIVAIQIVWGVLLFLFGFYEITTYLGERHGREARGTHHEHEHLRHDRT